MGICLNITEAILNYSMLCVRCYLPTTLLVVHMLTAYDQDGLLVTTHNADSDDDGALLDK